MNFSINDFDETLPAPWEWDLKRLAASIVVAGRYIDFKERDSLAGAASMARSYRRQMARYAEMRALDVWYDHIDVEQVIASLPSAAQKRLAVRVDKARARSVVEHDFPKLTDLSGGQPRIKHDPPLMFHTEASEHKESRDTNLGWKGESKYVATVPQIFDLWQDPQERYDLFMNNYTERTWTLVTISAAINELMKTYVKYPPRKAQSQSYTGPITISSYQKFQWMREELKKEGVSIELPTGN